MKMGGRITSTSEEETEQHRLRRLGRLRPTVFSSAWAEIGFLVSIATSQLLDEYLSSGFVALVPKLASELELSQSWNTWSVSVLSLVVSSFMLSFGRLADMYGGFPVYIGGVAWVLAWTFAAGFAQGRVLLICCRAMQGLGSAAHLSAGLTMLGTIYRPGPRKNVVFSVYGAMAPLGSFLGIAVGGLVSEYTQWSWYFWIGAMIAIVPLIGSWMTTPYPRLKSSSAGITMDWIGSSTLALGLILLVFTVTEVAHAPQGLRTPYILATGVIALMSLGATVYVEGWIAKDPLLPASALKIKYIQPLLVGLLFSYGTIGLYMLYATLYIRNIIGVGPTQLIAWFAPMAIGGCILALSGGCLMHLVSGNVILFITGIAIITASLLFALAPIDASYWIWIFPAMICATLSIDLVFSVANVFLSTTLPSSMQGLAGGLANTLVQLSIAVSLGVADVVVTSTSSQGEAQSYKNVFWLMLACGSSALLIFVLFVRLGKAESEWTADEKDAERRDGRPWASKDPIGTGSLDGDASLASIEISVAKEVK